SLKMDDALFTAVSRLIENESFYGYLNRQKANIIKLYLRVINGKYRDRIPNRNKFVETLVRFLPENRKFAFEFSEAFFLYSTSVNTMNPTIASFLDLLSERESAVFLA